MTRIEDIYAREILDSRGNPTVEVEQWEEHLYHQEHLLECTKQLN